MARYLAIQIVDNRLTYEKVMSKFEYLKQDIDTILREKNREDLIPR